MGNFILQSIRALFEWFLVAEQPRIEPKMVLVYVKGRDDLHSVGY